ncbi:MAG: D-inositol-3-phosphate glycosyltransferase [Acidimicrobiaceae bacterium]|nr:D-inositol-3-phosphate glycosyltransferase [Acidimicrobiaceae bacterium]
MRRLAVLSLHTSPLVQPGSGDGGGMNVYVRELASALAPAGVRSTVFTRRVDDDTPTVVDVEPGFRVVHVDAGPHDLAKEELPSVVDEFADGLAAHLAAHPDHDGILANYWLSGVAGHRLKHEMGLPLLTIFHTLARVKAETGDDEPQRRVDAESAVVGCSDVMLANSTEEVRQLVDLYGADSDRIEVVPPGVDHAFFSPGSQSVARRATGLGQGPVLLFAGRIQPLKGVDVAVRTLAELDRPDARLVVVGGASGVDGGAEEARLHELADAHDLADRVVFVLPQPHHVLATWYRAADVVLMPSRSESFGLVALEAAACGIPVVAAGVGGLRSLVEHGRTGYLVDGRDPADYACQVARILDDPVTAARMSVAATERSWSYTWSATAGRLRRICDDLASRSLVDCT